MPPVKMYDAHHSLVSGPYFAVRVGSGKQSEPEPLRVTPKGLTHEYNCGCAAGDLQEIVLVELESENRQLRGRLEQAEQTVSEMGRQMELQKSRTRQLIAGWKLKLEDGEEKMVALSKEKDEQLADLLSQLMLFEGCLKREREYIMVEMSTKSDKIQELEKTVKNQKKQIDALNRANERLLTSLHETLDGRVGEDSASDDSSSGSSCSSSGSRSTSSSSSQRTFNPAMARRKASMPATLALTNGNSDTVTSNNLQRQRKSPVSGPTPSHISPDSPRRRVRFDPGVQNNIKEGETNSKNERIRKYGPLRKISLPAYRLSPDEEGSIRYV